MTTPYSKIIMKHFRAPKNVGKIKKADGVGKAGNIICGDIMKLYLKIKVDQQGVPRIQNAKFETLGCVVAIANTSLLTTLISGKTIEEVLQINKEDLVRRLGSPLPPVKIHCSVLAVDALKEAIYDYYIRHKLPVPDKLKSDHRQIKKVRVEIEEKYQQLTKLENKILD